MSISPYVHETGPRVRRGDGPVSDNRRLLILFVLVDVTIKHRKDDEESQANQVLKSFDVLILVDDSEDLADFANRVKQGFQVEHGILHRRK